MYSIVKGTIYLKMGQQRERFKVKLNDKVFSLRLFGHLCLTCVAITSGDILKFVIPPNAINYPHE